ncbi:hypothetical protein [Parvicella tangerina]|uniref:Uncharacterized protein n=1 Tax=Parvicella tangerina TaxID=2829795 RepID=A0A916JPT5_9FLAO|nr:hypothetical protein [Parvicella tangerina]CAG5084722.1 hypothetical protein CRYO30217_02549 [Parvicella tangerina]
MIVNRFGALLVFCLAALLTSCVSIVDDEKEVHSGYHEVVAEMTDEDQLALYLSLKERIMVKQNAFQMEYVSASAGHQADLVALAEQYIFATLCDSIWSHWYDTPWEFYGTTEQPGKGSIACGYFVTTTLDHVGYHIDRVALAQQAASVIITTLCGKGKTKIIGNNDVEALLAYVKTQEDGVFICGLDNHVGFIQKTGGKIYFVHSSGLSHQQKVMKEELHKSNAIQYSKAYYVGNLLSNQENLIKWIKKEKIELQK